MEEKFTCKLKRGEKTEQYCKKCSRNMDRTSLIRATDYFYLHVLICFHNYEGWDLSAVMIIVELTM